MIRFLTLATLALVASPAFALDWYVEPNAAWDNDAGVSVEYVYTRGSSTGPAIGAAQVMIGPLQLGQPRPIAASQFEGRGEVVCLVANAARGDIRSPAVSDCYTFPLGAPSLSAPR